MYKITLEGRGTVKTEEHSQEGGFKSLKEANYKKPKSGSVQDKMSKEDIQVNIKDHVCLKTIQEKKLLTKMPLFKTWVKYYNLKTKKFRTGGLLMKLEYPKYIMLANPTLNLTWSVQLDENIIFISNKKIEELQEDKIKQTKDKLYELYKKGNLQIKKVV